MALLAQLWAHGVMVAYTHGVTLPLTLTRQDDLGSAETSPEIEDSISGRKENCRSFRFGAKVSWSMVMVMV